MKLLIEDQFPTIDVRTTKGDMTLPDEFAGQWFVFFQPPWRLHSGVHDRVRRLPKAG